MGVDGESARGEVGVEVGFVVVRGDGAAIAGFEEGG